MAVGVSWHLQCVDNQRGGVDNRSRGACVILDTLAQPHECTLISVPLQGVRLDTDRESIWSVPKEAKSAYYLLFIGQFLLGVWVLWSRPTTPPRGWEGRLVEGWSDAAALAVASAAVALVVTEIWRFVVVLSRGLYERLEREREARRQEGASEALRRAEEVMKRKGMSLEDIQRIIEETRKTVRNGGA